MAVLRHWVICLWTDFVYFLDVSLWIQPAEANVSAYRPVQAAPDRVLEMAPCAVTGAILQLRLIMPSNAGRPV